MNQTELLNDLYYKQHNYDGIDILYKKAKAFDNTIKKEFVKEWLNKQQNKQITTVKTSKKSFLPIYSETSYSFQIDLTFFPRYKKQNQQYNVLFTAININTRFAYAYYSKDKNMITILNMLKDMEKKTVINAITCDEGTEFNNREFIKYCDENDIELYIVKNDSHKLGIINRFHRTIKDKLTKYFIAKDTVKWIDIIDKIIFNYNHTINKGIGIEPYKVNNFIEHEIILWKRKETELFNNKNEDFNIGDKVRIINKKILFNDKMLPNYSSTVFTVRKVLKNSCILNNDIEVKKSQLLKIKDVDNIKDIVEIPKILKEERSKKQLEREKLDTVVLDRPKRERIPNSRYF
jgi:hypothetical protein